MPLRPGDPWGAPAPGPADLEIRGGDADLADVLTRSPGARIRYLPDARSDLARSLGIPRDGGPLDGEDRLLPVDALRVVAGDREALCVNAMVLGTPPGALRRWTRRTAVEVTVEGRPWRTSTATTVLVANGEFLDALDVVPRGHPGDGRAEVQLYELAPSQRAGMRRRLVTGTHVPHPCITARTARRVDVRAARPLRCSVDGRPWPPAAAVTVEVLPGLLQLVVRVRS